MHAPASLPPPLRDPATLLARSPGRYDLYLRDARQPGFGALRATDLTLNEAGAMLDLPTEHLDD